MRDGVIRFDESSDWLDAMAAPVLSQRTSYEVECRKTLNVMRTSATLTASRDLTFKQSKEALLGAGSPTGSASTTAPAASSTPTAA